MGDVADLENRRAPAVRGLPGACTRGSSVQAVGIHWPTSGSWATWRLASLEPDLARHPMTSGSTLTGRSSSVEGCRLWIRPPLDAGSWSVLCWRARRAMVDDHSGSRYRELVVVDRQAEGFSADQQAAPEDGGDEQWYRDP